MYSVLKQELDKAQKIFRSKIIIFGVLALLLISYGIKLVWFDYSIDTEVALTRYNYLLHSWLTVNRFGVVFIKRLMFPNMFNLYLANIFTYLTLFLVAITILIFLYRLLYGAKLTKGKQIALVIVAGLFITSPVMAEMFNFVSLSFEICVGLLAVVLSVYCAQLSIENKSWKFMIAAIMFAAFGFSIYQVLPAFFLAMTGGGILLYSRKELATKELLRIIATYVLVFVTALVVYVAIPHVYEFVRATSLGSNDYLSKQIVWGSEPTSITASRVYKAIKDVVTGRGVYFNLAFGTSAVLALMVMTYSTIRKRWQSIVATVLGYILVLLAPFSLMILLGSAGVLRNNMPALQLSTAVFFLYALYYAPHRLIKLLILIIGTGFVYTQAITTSNLLFLEHMKYEGDVALTNQIVGRLNDLGFSDYEHTKLVVLGTHASTIPNEVHHNLHGEAPFYTATDKSFYEWDNTSPVGVSDRAAGFMDSQGYDFQLLDPASSDDTTTYNDYLRVSARLPHWPEQGSVIFDKSKDVVVVNF